MLSPWQREWRGLLKREAATLSTELLYMKFLQGIPLLGAIGGAYNPVYLQKITRYAKLKYERRFLYDYMNVAR